MGCGSIMMDIRITADVQMKSYITYFRKSAHFYEFRTLRAKLAMGVMGWCLLMNLAAILLDSYSLGSILSYVFCLSVYGILVYYRVVDPITWFFRLYDKTTMGRVRINREKIVWENGIDKAVVRAVRWGKINWLFVTKKSYVLEDEDQFIYFFPKDCFDSQRDADNFCRYYLAARKKMA